jgi:predicted phage terminase large subunit-like protein
MTSLVRSLSNFDGRSLHALEQAALRETTRRAATGSLIDFTQYTYPRYEPAGLHRQIAHALECVERGEIDRLLIMCPPRHGKSELSSRRFPAWYLGRHPDHHFISASASFSLAEEFGRDVRNLMRAEEYAQVFDVQLAEDSQARGRWNTQAGGSYYAVGTGGALFGKGAHVALIDDPFSSMADARSPHIKDEVWSWYQGTLYNRLEKGGKIVVIAHRTAQDDLQGRLLEQQAAGGDKWTVVELKALDGEGHALWPEKYNEESLARIKANTSTQDWAALYDQNPTAQEGAFFKEEWLIPVDELPPRGMMAVYGASDYAVTSDGGDYTVHCVVGLDTKRRLYLLDLWRKQTAPGVWVESLCDLVKKWKPAFWAEERIQITAGIGPYLTARMREKQAFCGREQFVTRGDKAVRCSSIRGRMEIGGMRVLARAPWLGDLKAELLAFPHGRHDDQVDALGLAGQLIDRWQAGNLPVAYAKAYPGPEQFKDYPTIASQLEGDSSWSWKTI